LEDRLVPTVVYNSVFGGDSIFWVPGNSAGEPANQVQTGPISNNPSVLNSTTVYLDFWGDSWNETNAGALASAAQSIIQSKFFSQLSDYGFHGTVSYGGYTIDNTHTSDGSTSGDPQNGVNTTTEIQNLLNGKLDTDPNLPTSSWLRPPDGRAQDSPIYIVVYDNGTFGVNSVQHYTSSLVMNQIFIGDQGNNADRFTDTFSHEMAERISAGDMTGIEMNASTEITSEYQDSQISDNEPDDFNYTYRINGLNGQLVQAYWSLAYNAFVIPDGNTQAIYLNPIWTTGTMPGFNPPRTGPVYTRQASLFISGGQLANPDDTITLDETGAGGVSVNQNGEVFQFAPGQISGTLLTTDQAFSTVNVLATLAGTSTYIENQGHDTVVIGTSNGNVGNGAGYLGNIQGQVYVADNGDPGEPGSTVLYVDDSGDPWGQSVQMDSGQIYYGNAAVINYVSNHFSTNDVTELLVYGGYGGNTFNVQDTSELAYGNWINTGTGNDTVNVYGTSGWLEVNNPGGSDALNLGLGETTSLFGTVYAYGAGSTRLDVDDSKDTVTRTVTMNDGSLFGLGSGGIYWSPSSSPTGGVDYVYVAGSDGANTFNVNNTSNLYDGTFLDTVIGDSYVNVYATQGSLDVYNPGGYSDVDVGMGNMGSINGSVDVYGPGDTQLVLDDSSDSTARTVTMNDGSVTGLGGGTGSIYWMPTSSANDTGGVFSLSINGSGGGSTYNVDNTSNLSYGTYLSTGTSNDVVNVYATGSAGGLYVINQGGDDSVEVGLGSVGNINGTVYSYGSGATTLIVDDSHDSTSRTPTLATSPYAYNLGELTGLGNAGTVQYGSGVTALTIDGPSQGSTYDLQSMPSGTPVTVNGGAGHDTFDLGTTATLFNGNSGTYLSGVQSALTINGGGGTNTLNASDSLNSAQAYTLSSTQLAGSDFATITYAALSAIHVTGGGSDSLSLLSPVPTVATTFNGGTGSNTLIGANVRNLWTISGADSGKVDSVAFSNFQDLVGGATSNTFKFTSRTASVVAINGAGSVGDTNKLDYSALGSTFLVSVNLATGSAPLISDVFANINAVAGSTDTANSLTAADTTNRWTISGNDAGSVNAGTVNVFAFSAIGHLVGGTGVDTFAFSNANAKVLSINGGGAPAGQGDWLSYAALPSTSTVTVNLATGSATNVNSAAAGAVTNIQNVIGSATGTNILIGDSQGNILIGGSGANTLTGGSGGSLLIGGSGHGTITGGASTDILIAGTTTYSAQTATGQDALMSILAELHSADTFAQKVSDLIHGYGVDGGSHLNGNNDLIWGGSHSTVKASTGAFTLAGDAAASSAADWFFANAASSVSDFNDDGVKDEHNNNSLGVF
jgi:hypothetical protein